jgi:hypothetical protein
MISGNVYLHDFGVLLFGFGPDLLLILFSAAADSNSHP